eukprot:1142193-Pelagomonas_calceolata.AAC.7
MSTVQLGDHDALYISFQGLRNTEWGFSGECETGAEWEDYSVEAECEQVRNGKSRWLKIPETPPPPKAMQQVQEGRAARQTRMSSRNSPLAMQQ